MGRRKKLVGSLDEQVATITRVLTETGLNELQLAELLLIKPETMRKVGRGYQPAGEQLMQNIRAVPFLPSIQAKMDGTDTPPDPSRSVITAPNLAHHPVGHRLAFVLTHATPEERQIVSTTVDTAFKQISKRVATAEKCGLDKKAAAHNSIIRFPVGYKLRAVLGDIAAGLPQEAIQQADEWVAVAPKLAKDVTFVLRAKGDSMIDAGIEDGDLIYLNSQKDPRNGDVVAALCDHETCLKTYVAKGREQPYLKSENKAFPPEIKPTDELIVQGVMVGKHPKP